jgi:MoxR-like ATPase
VPFKKPLFKPKGRSLPAVVPTNGGPPAEAQDAYEFWDPRIIDAVNVALAARRPLLVTGAAGTGKSTLALAVARELRRVFVKLVVTSRTEVGDLTAGFDQVRRLADAQAGGTVLPRWAYVEPGVLWWAFEPETAATRGHDDQAELTDEERKRLPQPTDPRSLDHVAPRAKGVPKVVVLIDEIDKAEPDLPNDLLEPLDRRGFAVPDHGWVGAETDVFVVITNNAERRLPPAFLRRCVQLELKPDQKEFFVAVAKAHFGARDDDLYGKVADEHLRYVTAAQARNRREPSTAEFLDTLRACLQFKEAPGTGQWEEIVRVAMWKESELPELPEVSASAPAD